MALVVENGSGISNAESYISVADAATYMAKRGQGDAWGNLDDPEVALRKAMDYLNLYKLSWAGFRAITAQALDWPRAYVPDLDAAIGPFYNYYYPGSGNGGGIGMRRIYIAANLIPEKLKEAQADLALRTATTDDLIPDISQQFKSVQVGPIRVDYDNYSPQVTFLRGVMSKIQIYFKDAGHAGARVGRT
jgi:hypothetical protein